MDHDIITATVQHDILITDNMERERNGYRVTIRRDGQVIERFEHDYSRDWQEVVEERIGSPYPFYDQLTPEQQNNWDQLLEVLDKEGQVEKLQRECPGWTLNMSFWRGGTACCLGGTLEILTGRPVDQEYKDSLGLSWKQMDQLFFPESLAIYSTDPHRAARVVRHLLATGEVDWSIGQKADPSEI